MLPEMSSKPNPLRVCSICGLEAHTEEDLKSFVKSWNGLYGHLNRCKKCERERVSKTPKLIEVFRSRSPDGLIRCHFCERIIIKLEGRESESLNIHSLDGNHENWDPDNKVPIHKKCQDRHHNLGKTYSS